MEEVKVNKQQSLAKTEAAPLHREHGFSLPAFGRFFGASPFALMRQFTEEMDRAFNGNELATWAPTMNVRRCNGDLVVSAELPGLKKDEVKVELTDDALVIQGERKREHKEDHEGYHHYESSYGKFYRSVPLPEGAKLDQVKAELQDGVLKVSVPVPQVEKKVRQVPIEAKAAASTAKA